MVGCRSRRSVHSAQYSAEALPQGHDPALLPLPGEAEQTGQSSLRALLLLSGAVAPADGALAHTSDADMTCFNNIAALLRHARTSTHTA